MSHHVSRLLIKSIIKQTENFLLKQKTFLPFVPPGQSCCCLWRGVLSEVEWKMPRKTHGPQWWWHLIHQEKQKKSTQGAAALSGYPSADGCEALSGLFIFADLFDNVAEKVWCVVGTSSGERKHLLGKEKNLSRKVYCLMLSYILM